MDNKNHETFKRNLKKSHAGVAALSKWFLEKGYSVRLPPINIAPSQNQWEHYADGGDIFVENVVECKQLSCDFTSLNDWPFRNFIVCAKNPHDRKLKKPTAYYILNKSATHFAVVNVRRTEKSWFVRELRSSQYNDYIQEFYLCPLALVKFQSLLDE